MQAPYSVCTLHTAYLAEYGVHYRAQRIGTDRVRRTYTPASRLTAAGGGQCEKGRGKKKRRARRRRATRETRPGPRSSAGAPPQPGTVAQRVRPCHQRPAAPVASAAGRLLNGCRLPNLTVRVPVPIAKPPPLVAPPPGGQAPGPRPQASVLYCIYRYLPSQPAARLHLLLPPRLPIRTPSSPPALQPASSLLLNSPSPPVPSSPSTTPVHHHHRLLLHLFPFSPSLANSSRQVLRSCAGLDRPLLSPILDSLIRALP